MKKPDEKLDSGTDKIFIEDYLVAFVDLLGQQEELAKMVSLPLESDTEAYQDFIKVIQKTIGAVKGLQRDTENFFNAFLKNKNNPIKNIIPRMGTREIKFQNFSDGLVIYVPLGNRHESSAMSAVYGVLISCGLLTLLGLAKKQPVRVGISVGLATEVDGDLYGKAVADAYIAESKVAQLPRAIVTENVLDYINFKSASSSDNIVDQFEVSLVDTCKKILSYDYDGNAIINYLGEDFLTLVESEGFLSETVVPKAYEFVLEQLELHQLQKNSKLAMRYSLLHGYFSHHLDLKSRD